MTKKMEKVKRHLDMKDLKGMKIAIATPFYAVSGFSPYIRGLVQTVIGLTKSKLDFDFWDLSGDSYVFRARNSIATRFLNSDRTHLFFIDSDHEWDIQGFVNVLTADADFAGAAYPCKNNWEFYSVIIYNNEDGTPRVDKRTGLIEAWGVPTGFCKISKSVFERMVPIVERYKVKGPNPEDKITYDYNFFGHIIRDESLFGEDISFNIRAEDLGIKRWVVPDVNMAHYGIKAWTGNYSEYLMRAAGGSKEGQAPVEVFK